jgi:hypothetical protein
MTGGKALARRLRPQGGPLGGADRLRLQQRVRKRQPEGGLAGLGISPLSGMRARRFASIRTTGSADSRAAECRHHLADPVGEARLEVQRR